jgi:50S ribosomal protein L16 3-hydroxylase
VEGMYADPDLKTQKHPSEISSDMLNQVGAAIGQVRWDKGDIANFLGCYLSEPKPHIFFDAPDAPPSLNKFEKSIKNNGMALDLKSQMLCHDGSIFINGESIPATGSDYVLLRSLADNRQLPAQTACSDELAELLYQWYLDGYIFPL